MTRPKRSARSGAAPFVPTVSNVLDTMELANQLCSLVCAAFVVAPWREKPDANTSMVLSSFAEIATHVPNFALNRTDALASRQMRAKERSGPSALSFSRPERGQAARSPHRNAAPHERVSSVMLNGRRSLPNTNVRNNSGCNWNSNPVGHPSIASIQPLGPSGKNHGLPKVVFGRGRRVILPAMLPLATFGIKWWKCSDLNCPQLVCPRNRGGDPACVRLLATLPNNHLEDQCCQDLACDRGQPDLHHVHGMKVDMSTGASSEHPSQRQ